MTDEFRTQLNRRTLIQGAIATAASLSSAASLAASRGSDLKAIKRAVDANSPRIAGLREATMGHVEFLCEMASTR